MAGTDSVNAAAPAICATSPPCGGEESFGGIVLDICCGTQFLSNPASNGPLVETSHRRGKQYAFGIIRYRSQPSQCNSFPVPEEFDFSIAFAVSTFVRHSAS